MDYEPKLLWYISFVAGVGGVTLHAGAGADLLVDRVPDGGVRGGGGQIPVVLPVPGDELHVLHAVRDDDGGADPQHRDRHGVVVPHLHLLERLLRLHHLQRGARLLLFFLLLLPRP